jgi:hypothetical protein
MREWGCWPLLARIAVTDELVTWDSFEQPHRKERDCTVFGPFRAGSCRGQNVPATVPSHHPWGVIAHRQCLALRIRPDNTGERARALKVGERPT